MLLLATIGLVVALYGGIYGGSAKSPGASDTPGTPGAEQKAGTPSEGDYRYEVATGDSEALYRVREELVNVPLPVDAVGRTRQVEGTVVFDEDGQVVPELSAVRVNLAALESDQSRRDNFLRQNTLQTAQYPEAVLVPVEVRGLEFPLPEQGSAPVTIVGDMTIRDVTRRVEWTGTARFEPGGMRIEAGTAFTFADFKLDQPRVPILLSVDDMIRLEANVRLTSAGGPNPPDAAEENGQSAAGGAQ
ncbi:MAG: YceI family protein [Firmicutes bacterium]|nr:YceI family protein [Bacillota bacterium]